MDVEQNVPLGPVDRRHAFRRRARQRLGRTLRFHLPLVLGALGLGLAAVGLWLSISPGQVSVSEDASAYTIGDARLPATGDDAYAGPEGAVVVRREGRTVRAAASTTLNGRHMTGRCVWQRDENHESCQFNVEGRAVAATDTRTPTGWHRRYDDGEDVDIHVLSGGPVPVPFAVGLR